jgi:hypothetical protein
MNTKRFIAICAFLLPIVCTGQNIDIKLDCQLSLTKQFKSGTVTKETINEIFEVVQYNEAIVIRATSNTGNLGSVTTVKNPDILSFSNTSDKNRWSLETVFKTQNGYSNKVSISIDRNTGSIFYTANYEGGVIDEGKGTCKKIDTTKKLF